MYLFCMYFSIWPFVFLKKRGCKGYLYFALFSPVCNGGWGQEINWWSHHPSGLKHQCTLEKPQQKICLTPSVKDRNGFQKLQPFWVKRCSFDSDFDHFQPVWAVYSGGFLRYCNWKVRQSIAIYSALWASIGGRGGVRALMAKLMWEMGGNHCRWPGLNSWTQLGQVWVCTLGPRGHIR